MTLLDELFAYWERFLMKHADGELIEPVSRKRYNEIKCFKRKAMSLKKEFFRHCGHFMHKDYGVLVQHLLGETPKRRSLYSKLSMVRTRILVADYMTIRDWI